MLPSKPLRFRPPLACLLLTLAVVPGLAAGAARTDVHGDPLPDGVVARAGTVRWRAGAPVVLCAYLADGRSVLTVAQDYVAQVRDTTSGKELRRFDVAGGPAANAAAGAAPLLVAQLMRGVAASADGTTLAVSGRDGIIRVWDVATGKERARLEPDAAPQQEALSLSRDGKRLARTAFNQRTTVHDAATGRRLAQFGEAPGPGPGGRMIRVLPYHIRFGPDGKTLLLITSERDAAARLAKMALTIWDIESGKELKRFDDWPAPPGPGPAARPAVRSSTLLRTVVSPDHKLAALPLDAKTIVLFDLAAGKEVRRIEGRAGLGGMGFTADGKSLVMAAGPGVSAAVCDVGTGKVTRSPAPGDGATGPGVASVLARAGRSFAVADDGKSYLWPEGPTLHLIDVATGKDRNAFAGHATFLQQVIFTADGKSLLTVAGEAVVRRWEAATGKESASFASPGYWDLGVALSPDGKILALYDPSGDVRLIDVAKGDDLQTLKFGGQPLERYAVFSPDSRTVAITSPEEAKVHLYDVATGRSKRELVLPNRPEDEGIPVQRRVAFSPDGRLVAVSDVALHVWETATGRTVRVLPIPEGAALRHAAFSPDGRTLAMELGDGEVQLVELASGRPRLVLNAHTRVKADPDLPPGLRRATAFSGIPEGTALAVAPDGRLLAQAGEDGTVRVWDLRTGKQAARLAGHRGQVTALAFSADGTRLASGGTDTTALVWDAEAVRRTLPGRAAPLTREKAEALWEVLGSADAGRSYEAVRGLAGDPARALPLLRERVKPVAGADPKVLAKLVADLDADEFDTREKARKELERLGDSAAGALRQALRNRPSAEVKRTVEELLAGLGGSAPSEQRLLLARAVEALEMIGTPQAVEVLKSLAGGDPDAYLTTQARAALERLPASRR
jgi:WD40 repeat protein